MTISVVEIDYHAEVLRNLLLIFENSDYRVKLFTTEKIWKQVNQSYSDNIIVYKSTSRKALPADLKSWQKEMIACDMIIFNSLASHYRFFSKLPYSSPVILRIHNANTYLNPKREWDFGSNLSDFKYTLNHLLVRSLIRSENYFRRKFLKNVDQLMAPGLSVSSFIKSQRWPIGEKLSSYSIPQYVRYHETRDLDSQKPLKICVTGSIESKRKDFNILLSAFKLLVPQLKTSIELVFLGKAVGQYGRKIVTSFSEMTNSNFKLTTFDGFVPQEEFDNHMGTASFAILPIKVNTRYQIYQECYGRTKISGGEGDCIKYGTPFIRPSDYKPEISSADCSSPYEDERSLADLILKWIDAPPQLDSSLLKRFDLEVIKKDFKEWAESI